MKILKVYPLLVIAVLFGHNSLAQCLEITCPTDIEYDAPVGSCEVVVDFENPTALDLCILTDTTTLVYEFTGDVQEFVVPEGVSSIQFILSGAEGGISAVDFDVQEELQIPGEGGQISGDLEVESGQVYSIYVGEKGGNGSDGSGGTGGYNGGGNGNFGTSFSGGGGGGATDIRLGGTTLEDRIIVAGGGGGSAVNFTEDGGDNGGNGGDLVGQAGLTGDVNGEFPQIILATGGTQSEGGAGGEYEPWNPGFDGDLGTGGLGGFGTSGGGGGGGYYGGGGGSWTGGAGGSSYAMDATNVVHNQGGNTGDGLAIIKFIYNAELDVVLESGIPLGEAFPIGVTEQVYTATGELGNTISCSFNVTVNPPAYPVTVAASTLSSDESAEGYQWINCEDNSLIDGATDQSYTAEALGFYAVILTNGSCVDTTDCYEVSIIGIEEHGLLNGLQVYPNPTSGLVFLEFHRDVNDVLIQLFSADGKEVYQKRKSISNRTEIDLGPYENGLYIVSVSSEGEVITFQVSKN